MSRPRRPFWQFSGHEVRAHASLLAIATWAMVAYRWTKAPIIAGDFVQPYTMGALIGDPQRLYTTNAYHSAQVALVPGSASLFYAPVFPPQLALFGKAFTLLPFTFAAAVWCTSTIALYAVIVWRTHRGLPGHRLNGRLVALAAIAFPPFSELVAYGQITVLLLGACYLAWRALERQRPFLAGIALGLLAVKPQLGVPFVVIVLSSREWRMMAGAIVSIAAQAALVWMVMGHQAFTGYAAMVPDVIRNTNALEAVSWRSHSLRALTRLLPPPMGTVAWVGATGVVLWYVARVWQSAAPIPVRLGVAVLAAVLVSPHLIVYDATMLVLPLLWFGDWFESRETATKYRLAIYLLFAAFAIPVAAIIRIQPSVIILLWIAWMVARSAVRSGEVPSRDQEGLTSSQPSVAPGWFSIGLRNRATASTICERDSSSCASETTGTEVRSEADLRVQADAAHLNWATKGISAKDRSGYRFAAGQEVRTAPRHRLGVHRLTAAAVLIIGIMLAFDVIVFRAEGLTYRWVGWRVQATLIGGLLIAWLYFLRWPGRQEGDWITAETFLAMALFFALGDVSVPGGYAALALKRPLIDAWLASADAAIGIHVPSVMAWTAGRPRLTGILIQAYNTLPFQFLLPIGLLGYVHRNRTALWEFVFVFYACTFLTGVILALWPSYGPYVYYAYTPLIAQQTVIEQITAIRAGTMTVVDSSRIVGLVAMPSFHTAAALCATWALRRYRLWMAILIPTNALLIAATVLSGIHWMADVVAGIAMWAISAALYRLYAQRWLDPVRPHAAVPLNAALSDVL